MRKILPTTLEVGQPIPYDCFDAQGKLLLRRGYVLRNQLQLNELIDRGLYERTDETQSGPQRNAPMVSHVANPFDLLERCKNRLLPMLNQVRVDNATTIPESLDIEALKVEYRNNIALRLRDSSSAIPEGFVPRVLEIAGLIQQACALDADAVLGHVHLTQNGRYAIMHPLHCAILAEVLGSALGMPQEQRLPMLAAALTANISILNLQDRLHKQDAAATPLQQALLRLHPVLSCEMLQEAGVTDAAWLQCVLQHHERFDGSGYPFNQRADDIVLSARILSLVDIYDAMIKPRGERKPVTPKRALRDIFMMRGAKVDEPLAAALIKELSVYPPGSFVRLKNGETAIVFRRGKTATTPLARSVVGSRGAMLDRPLRRDTADTSSVIVDAAPYDPTVRTSFVQLWEYGRE